MHILNSILQMYVSKFFLPISAANVTFHSVLMFNHSFKIVKSAQCLMKNEKLAMKFHRGKIAQKAYHAKMNSEFHPHTSGEYQGDRWDSTKLDSC